MRPELVAPCGINCAVCVGFFGYTMSGTRRKHKCLGCRTVDELGKSLLRKNCAFLKQYCKLLRKGEVEFCFECPDYPCSRLRRLDDRYTSKYNVSIIENLNFIREHGKEKFLKTQKEKYQCPTCGGTICVHTNVCYNCQSIMEST